MGARICVLGAGPGGYAAAVRAAQGGADVTLVERENPGGTCLNWGCIPSKVMITTAELLERMRRAEDFGIQACSAVRPDMARLMTRKNRVIQDQIKGLRKLFEHHRIRYLQGEGRLTAEGPIAVTLPEGGHEAVDWERLILATGTRPTSLPGLEFDGAGILSSNDALGLDHVPASVLIVGGGVIGCEFAHILAALGAEVTVVEAMERLIPLPSVDPDCTKVLLREMKKRKIKCQLNRTVTRVDQMGEGLRVEIGASPFLENPSVKDLEPLNLTVDCVLVSVGRRPNTDGIGLEHTGVTVDGHGWIDVDEHLRTADPRIWAIGDVLGPDHMMLAHAATFEAGVAAANAMGAASSMDYAVVPNAIFTAPELATVGLTEHQARQAGLAIRAETALFRSLGKAQVIGEIAGQAKIVFEEDTGRIRGVHLIGPHVTELVAAATLAVKQKMTVADLADTIHAHPTLAEILGEVALKAAGRPLHS